jgi:LysM repeat protein
MRRVLVALALSLVVPLPALAGEVTVKEGETLSEIAARHNVPLSRLLKLNGIQDPDLLQVGQKLKLPSVATRSEKPETKQKTFTYDRKASNHVVRPGETLTQIAKGHGIALKTLVAINAIEDADKVRAGTKLRLKGPAPVQGETKPAPERKAGPAAAKPASTPAKPAAKPASTAAEPAATATRPPQQSMATPSAPATTAEDGTADWRSYGPLRVDWASWRPMGGSLVAPTMNDAGLSFYLAVNCEARKINATSKEGQWQSWEPPKEAFEEKLIRDRCAPPGT